MPIELKTRNNLHNLQFQKGARLYSPKWKYKRIIMRQIMDKDDDLPETWFVLRVSTLELYVYFESVSTKEEPRVLRIGKLPQNYQFAIDYLAGKENAILRILNHLDQEELDELKEDWQLEQLISNYPAL